MIKHSRRRRTVLLLGAAALVAAVSVSLSCEGQRSSEPARPPFDPHSGLKVRTLSGEGPSAQVLVDEGTPEEAEAYAQHIKDELGIEKNARLDDVLGFCGYTTLTGHAIEATPSDQLMAQFPGDVVASRFFAPKIIDVSDLGGAADKKPIGWRKVVRLRVRAGSPAEAKGISAMFLLFNVFQDRTHIADDPFAACAQSATGCSQNNQAMLVIGTPQPDKDTAFWLVFKDAAINGGERTDNLPATFDGGDIQATTSVRPYYLPAACADCHGNSAEHAKLNYLDTDHWNDRVQDGDDFAVLRTGSQHGVLFDGGRDTTTPAFSAAFAAVRTLNTEIRDQNRTAGGEDFQIRAVENWLRIHETNTNFLPVLDRAIPAPASNPTARVWSAQNANDEALLKLLNRFCFRCHSSVSYHVFDKQAVFSRKAMIKAFVNANFMPQDRQMNTNFATEKAMLLNLINGLQ